MWHTLHPTISIKKKGRYVILAKQLVKHFMFSYVDGQVARKRQCTLNDFFSDTLPDLLKTMKLLLFYSFSNKKEQLIANFKRSTWEHIWLICFAWDQISHWVGIFRGVVVWEVPRLKSSHPKKCNVNFIDSCPNCEILFSRRKQSIVPLITKKVILIYFIFVLLFNYLQFVFSFAPSGLPRVQPTYTQLRGRSGTQGETLKRKPLKKQ